MKKLRILGYQHKSLRAKCRPIKNITNARKKKIKQMLDLIYEEEGMGLAAPQVGWNAKVFVMNITRDPSQQLVFINPMVVQYGVEAEERLEGCLSIPGKMGLIKRPKFVKILAKNIDGNEFVFEDDDWGSRCAQHELDHLHGILLTDRTKKIYNQEELLL